MYDNLKKTVIITGGNKGIGLFISKKFLAMGYNVFVGARTSIKDKIFHQSNLFFVKIDARKYSSHQKIIFEALKKTGRVDAYINNVGQSNWKPIEKINEKFLNEMIEVNLKSVFWGCKAVTTIIKKNFNIINISSIAGKRGSANNSTYCSTKFAVNGLTQSLAKELGSKNIRVNAICPVLVKTDGLKKALKNKYSPATKNINLFFNNFIFQNSALNKLPSGEDVANLCYFLCTENSDSITGQCINLDCGVFPQ